MLGHMVDPRWFDVEAITDAGNLAASQMQSGFSAMRPTLQLAKLVGQYDRMHVPGARQSLDAIERWGSDNIPFPAAAYRTYIAELYQQNLLARGEHRVRGRVARLSDITCPVMAITAERDAICPPPAALALLSLCGSDDTRALSVPGGHVGAVVGGRASRELYPAVAQWLRERLDAPLPKTAATE
jgi:polyhydroxyalkanoate synthase